jgi:hypothetical protein
MDMVLDLKICDGIVFCQDKKRGWDSFPRAREPSPHNIWKQPVSQTAEATLPLFFLQVWQYVSCPEYAWNVKPHPTQVLILAKADDDRFELTLESLSMWYGNATPS